MQETGPRLNVDGLKQRYLLPGRPYIFVEQNGDIEQETNKRSEMQLPIEPLNKKRTLKHNFRLPPYAKYFV
jgi:hypothetical protein